MHLIILTAGYGTRLRPHTYSKPKSLVSVAGKPMLGQILDRLSGLQIDQATIVTGYLGEQIEAYVPQHYSFPCRFVEQTELRGQAHAILLAQDGVGGPALVMFGDGIIEADFAQLNSEREAGVAYVQEVQDPRRFGVAVLNDEGHITRLVEKPATPVSNLAVIGAYYFPEVQRLFSAIDHIIEQDIQIKGEYYLADALQAMIDRGERFRTASAQLWKDCGTVEALLSTNRYLLDNGAAHEGGPGTVTRSVIIPPVYIHDDARIVDSVIGPHVAVSAGATITESRIKDSIVNEGAQLRAALLRGSLIGERTEVSGSFQTMNIGTTASVLNES
jgi:glucose-1-phosphate thymidylyltransferase